ncbi:putative ABC transporter ATP-binding protein YxlF [Sedimentisphaera cyanobacteriorum]|uniref:Putative ABC transporter ATP-binding protein YxlF n=1 Tax=Sedimentisphaera cyanobacteriorum TaxID=1940790 RepID=A0A1Q2HNA5_9BACT|nr:ABC transporter ATP-binding protein [Sedimentisphaera cyanobacteriorum]AQQ08734.1 putative ABC transporter ATP-binding protein YxlF [Sedimentisphaera cyanobacteriorum]
MSEQYAIETISLTKAFKDWWGRTKVLAVDDLNLKIKRNEVYGLLGPNGSGKSTTIKVLLSLLHPTKGKSFILGADSREKRVAERIGFLPEESYLYKYLSAKETLKFYGNLFGIPSKVLNMRIESLLDMVGLSAVANRPIGTFSKGMQRRIGLAQALVNDPDVLILDEPTSGLDPIGTRQIKDLIKKLAERGKTVLMCSHLLADVEDVCDRICVLYGGRVQCEGSVKDLLRQTGKKQIIAENIQEDALEKACSVIQQAGGACEVSSPQFRLEDLFIQVVEKAQKEKIATGGAYSTGKIGSFLGEEQQEDKTEKVLDELVSADVSKKEETEKTRPEPETQPAEHEEDKKVLSELVKEEDSNEEKAESGEDELTPAKEEKKKQEPVKDDVLKDLMGDDDA